MVEGGMKCVKYILFVCNLIFFVSRRFQCYLYCQTEGREVGINGWKGGKGGGRNECKGGGRNRWKGGNGGWEKWVEEKEQVGEIGGNKGTEVGRNGWKGGRQVGRNGWKRWKGRRDNWVEVRE